MKFIQFTVLVLSMVISAGLGLAAKFSSDWNQSTVTYFAGLSNDIDTSVQETLTANNILFFLECIALLCSLFSCMFSHCRFQGKLSRLFLALVFILSTIWIAFAYLFLYGSIDFNESMEKSYVDIHSQDGTDTQPSSEGQDQTLQQEYNEFVESWRVIFNIRRILIVILLPMEVLYVILFRKFLVFKKEQLEQFKFNEMRKIYDQLEQSQL